MNAQGFDSKGAVIKCDHCDKDAGEHYQGIDYRKSYCEDHSPSGKIEASFVYKDQAKMTPEERYDQLANYLLNKEIDSKDKFHFMSNVDALLIGIKEQILNDSSELYYKKYLDHIIKKRVELKKDSYGKAQHER